MIRRPVCLAALLAMAAAPMFADAGDPPSRVARLNYKSGQVSFRPGSVEEWTEATLNYPLTLGDRLWTQTGSQAELHTGSTAIRMAPETALAILNLDDRTVQLSLTQGALNVHIRVLGFNENFEVDTPNAAIALLRPGDYRIDADSDKGLTTVAVRDGEADVSAGGSTSPVRMRESLRIAGTDQVTQEAGPVPPPNEFDRWCEGRDLREQQSRSVQYVSRETIGYEDLDEYGVWRQVPPYGWVWVPAGMQGDWAPYHYGHWAWVDPWGWTWIDDAPWGFAPFHYGRWAYAGGGWLWVPGAMAPRPVYAPALVAFVGGPRLGVSIGLGAAGVAWFALGPGEVYRPAYRVSDVYVRQVNVTQVNVTNINVVNVRYANQNVRGAVTVVPQEAFVTARPVARAAVAVDEREIGQAQVVGAAPPVAPRRESVMAAQGPGRVAAPPARFVDHAVVARTAPPPPPVSFAAKQGALQANQGRPLDAGATDNLRRSAPQAAPAVRTVQAPPGGFRQANPGGNAAPAQAARPPAQNVTNDRPPQNREPARSEQPAVRSDRPAQAATPPAQNVTNDRPPQNREPARSEQPAPRSDRPAQAATPTNPPAKAMPKEKAPPKKGEKPNKKEDK